MTTTRNGLAMGAALGAVLTLPLIAAPAYAGDAVEWRDTSDTVLLCHFNEGSGDTARDVSAAAKGRKGRLVGGVKWTEGRFGKALLLDGKDDAVDFGPYRSVFRAPLHTTLPEGAVEFWFSPARDIRGSSRFCVVVGCCQAPRFYFTRSGELEASYVAKRWTAKNVHRLKSGLTSWDAGAWYRVTFSWNSKGHSLFINDAPVASDRIGDGVLAAPNSVALGAYWNGRAWSNHFAGRIDEFRIVRPRPPPPDATRAPTKTATGVFREVRQLRGTVTGNTVKYTLFYPPDRTGLPVLFHHYGKGGAVVDATNERVAGYGVFCASVSLDDSHCGYELQDYKDAIDDIYGRYADKIDTDNVTLMGVSYGGAVTYGMAVRFPYLFDAAIPIFGISDFGYDDEQSWWKLIEKNSPKWGPLTVNMPTNIGDRAKYRDTRYLVRNAVFGAKNNPYAHFEILQDVNDGVGRPGVQAENSRRFVAELRRLGYTNYRYTETPKDGCVYPEDKRLSSRLWGRPITYGHSFFRKSHSALYHFELYTLTPAILSGAWKRPPFHKTDEIFVPSFLETPLFRIDLGRVENNCDEAADVKYDVSSPTKRAFEIVPRTRLTTGRLRLMRLKAGARYVVTLQPQGAADAVHSVASADERGALAVRLPETPKGGRLRVECAAERRGAP